jgi:NAD(P)H dehydrogenase (quinone)
VFNDQSITNKKAWVRKGGVSMQVLIMYYSATGKTKELAEAIAKGVEAVPGVACKVKSCDTVTEEDFVNANAIIAGSPVYFGTMAAQLKSVFDKFITVRKKMENKIGAAFATSNDLSGGKETTMLSIIQAMLIYGMIITGDPIEATGHYGVSCKGRPDEIVCQNAFKLGNRVASLVKRLNG